MTRASQEDGRSDEQHSKTAQGQNPWDEHLSTQEKQADRYRPPLVTGLDIQVSRGKFLGRLAILILGVGWKPCSVCFPP